jgi:acyl-CoA thioesterase
MMVIGVFLPVRWWRRAVGHERGRVNAGIPAAEVLLTVRTVYARLGYREPLRQGGAMAGHPDETARRSAEAMWASDRASRWLGARIDTVGPGTATLSMTVEEHHCNGHDICHGGFIFTLADSAFAFACNSYNDRAVAQHNVISFIAPGRKGDTLTAVATEVAREGRSGIYDALVTNQNGTLIATFRGASRTIGGYNYDPGEDRP